MTLNFWVVHHEINECDKCSIGLSSARYSVAPNENTAKQTVSTEAKDVINLEKHNVRTSKNSGHLNTTFLPSA